MFANTYTGTAEWKHKVDVGKIFQDDELTFHEKRDKVVEVLRASSAIKDGEPGEELAELVEELSETEDIDEFDWVWGAIYDLADHRKWLWINTF